MKILDFFPSIFCQTFFCPCSMTVTQRSCPNSLRKAIGYSFVFNSICPKNSTKHFDMKIIDFFYSCFCNQMSFLLGSIIFIFSSPCGMTVTQRSCPNSLRKAIGWYPARPLPTFKGLSHSPLVSDVDSSTQCLVLYHQGTSCLLP